MLLKNSMPVLGKASFTCPHCGAIAHQSWYKVKASEFPQGESPSIPTADIIHLIENNRDMPHEDKTSMLSYIHRSHSGLVFFTDAGGRYGDYAFNVNNLWISQCYSCEEISVWVHERLLFSAFSAEIVPNSDLPDDIKRDFTEAATILDRSPRGSAALLRLCIQKLCRHLGKSGKDLNADIASLAKDGLHRRIQKSLDIVRVIGNNAVHPGQIDLQDDMDTASKLFLLVNLIADVMITQPKHVDELYETLPESAKTQIENRNSR